MPAPRAGAREHAGADLVAAPRGLDLGLGLIDLGVGRGVDHQLRSFAPDRGRNGAVLRDVGILPRKHAQRHAALARHPRELLAELAVAEHQDHATTPSRSPR